jgi:hypothetical protein
VTIVGHGLPVNASITFPIVTTVGGMVIQGTYRVISVVDANNFLVNGGNQASVSAGPVPMNFSNAQLIYDITLGPGLLGGGYSSGAYSAGSFSIGGAATSFQSGTKITARDWSLDNWGETVIGCPKGGGLYYWAPDANYNNVKLISTGPVFNTGCFVAMPSQILVAFGSTFINQIGINQDPLLINWSDALNFNTWVPTATNQAGSFHIPTGSYIVGAIQAPNQAIIWTDIEAWSMVYTGVSGAGTQGGAANSLIFAFNRIGAGCGLIGMHARCQLRGNVYWMSFDNFYTLGGIGVTPIPCTVWDIVFQNLDKANQGKCVAWANSLFNEIFFFFPSLSGGTGENDTYVKYNVVENAWDYGSLGRSAAIDESVLGPPIASISSGLIYQHEVAVDADGSSIDAYFETGYFMLNEGTNATFVDMIYPDMRWGKYSQSQTANIILTPTAVIDGDGVSTTKGPYTVTTNTIKVPTRLRGNKIKIRVESNDVGSFWRLGNIRYRAGVDGRR